MEHFTPLHVLIDRLWSQRTTISGGDLPFRAQASFLAIHEWGKALAMDMPALVNVAALALSLPRLAVHQVAPGASHLVQSTTLGSLPTEPPGLMRNAWLIESRRPERGETLFGKTVSLGGYWLEGSIYLLGVLYPDGMAVASWKPGWGTENQPDLPESDLSPLVADVEGHTAWAREAALYIVRLGLLLEARESPIETIAPTPKKKSRQHKQKVGRDSGWAVRRVRLLHTESHFISNPDGASQPTALPKEDRTLLPTIVNGHLRRVAVGVGKKERAWRWIASHEAHRWMRNKTQVVIDL